MRWQSSAWLYFSAAFCISRTGVSPIRRSRYERRRRAAPHDGEMLVAWHVPPRDGHPLILYFHGNGGALVDRIPRFCMFAASGYGVLAVSYAAMADRPDRRLNRV
jgi:acetyl esterase/lipase